MRVQKSALSLLLTAAFLIADSPFAGQWKLNPQRSRQETANLSTARGALPRDEGIDISDQARQLHVTVVGTAQDGSPIAFSYSIPINGGTGQLTQGGRYNRMSAVCANSNTIDNAYSRNGSRLATEHMVVSGDGQTMTVRMRGVDSNGQPVEQVLVFDKQ